jgi:hypothetical protein
MEPKPQGATVARTVPTAPPPMPPCIKREYWKMLKQFITH